MGPWLRELKHAVLTGAPGRTPIHVQWRDREGEHAMMRQVNELRHLILDLVPGQRIGYVTDLRSRTQGRGSYSMEFDHYEVLPQNLADQVINKK